MLRRQFDGLARVGLMEILLFCNARLRRACETKIAPGGDPGKMPGQAGHDASEAGGILWREHFSASDTKYQSGAKRQMPGRGRA